MRWSPRARNPNLEDRRGSSGGMGGALPKMGIGGFVVLLLLSFVFKRDFFALVGGGGAPQGAPAGQEVPVSASPEETQLVEFVNSLLYDTEETWGRIFAASGKTYQPPQLVLFRNAVRSGCGTAESSVGPFYCPADGKVYIDLSFYEELRGRFGADGDFAQAYVIAHEIGHHVQNLLGISDEVRQAQQQDPGSANDLSVRLELQADCFAGVWANGTEQSKKFIEPGDVEEAMGAAAAVGDDRIQQQSTGQVNPESWTHGSSQDRMRWFQAGLQSGDLKSCDTFAAR
ncbi:MAG TPA: neutral zinc metallopeptidase [Thermoanaerobaculia bacterium]|nr:neutral zinc metallopeptidase [Thermoanaerobaculia bacterium]